MKLYKYFFILLPLCLLFSNGCVEDDGLDKTDEPGKFQIRLKETCELLISDKDITAYTIPNDGSDRCSITINETGLKRIRSFITWDNPNYPEIPVFRKLYKKEVLVTLAGKKIYSAKLWSLASSLIEPGIMIYDIITINTYNGIFIEKTYFDDNGMNTTVINHREVVDLFRDQNKLVIRPASQK